MNIWRCSHDWLVIKDIEDAQKTESVDSSYGMGSKNITTTSGKGIILILACRRCGLLDKTIR